MRKEITLSFLNELKKEILNNKMEYLNIKKEENRYIADYNYSQEELKIDTKVSIKIFKIVNEFSDALFLNKVIDFYLDFKHDCENIIINMAYDSSLESEPLLEDYNELISSLDKSIYLIERLNLSNKTFGEIYFRSEIETKSRIKSKYTKASLKSVFHQIQDCLEKKEV